MHRARWGTFSKSPNGEIRVDSVVGACDFGQAILQNGASNSSGLRRIDLPLSSSSRDCGERLCFLFWHCASSGGLTAALLTTCWRVLIMLSAQVAPFLSSMLLALSSSEVTYVISMLSAPPKAKDAEVLSYPANEVVALCRVQLLGRVTTISIGMFVGSLK